MKDYVRGSYRIINFIILFREGIIPSSDGHYVQESHQFFYIEQFHLDKADINWITKISNVLSRTMKNTPLSFRYVFKHVPLEDDSTPADFSFDDSFLIYLYLTSVCLASCCKK